MLIQIRQEEQNKFSIQPDELLVARIANLLHRQDFCRVTETQTRYITHTEGSVFEPSSQVITYTGLVEGTLTDPSATLKDIADLIAKEFSVPAKASRDNTEYLIADKEGPNF